jgi:hypothetical protein
MEYRYQDCTHHVWTEPFRVSQLLICWTTRLCQMQSPNKLGLRHLLSYNVPWKMSQLLSEAGTLITVM